MDRREAITTAGVLTLAALTGTAQAQEHMHEHHHGGGTASRALIDATGSCVATGEACLAHCLVLLGDGDKAMAECAKSVNQMLATCGALQKLATQGSRLTGAMASVALEACTECEKACKKHADKHAECKACMTSCAECAKQCKALVA